MTNRYKVGAGGGGSGTSSTSGGGGGSPLATTKASVAHKQYGTTFEHLSISRDDNSQAAHGLSKAPDGIDAYLECTTADLGYAIGDRVNFAYTTRGLWWYDDTNIGWAGYSQRPYITHKTNNNEGEVGDNDWKAVAKPFIYLDQDVVTDVSGGGGGGSGTTLTPETGVQVYDAADEHNIVNVDGTLYEVEKRHTSGHSKVVELEILDDTRFRGFFTRANEVLNPLHDQFIYLLGPGGVGGGFEKYSTGAPTGFFPGYNPFATGEPWHTALVATGIDYVGDFTYRGHVSSQADLERNASAAGEVYTVLDARVVMFVDEYTAPSAGQTIYFGSQVVPKYFNNPTALYWGIGQTERWPSTYPNGDDGQAIRRLRFVDSSAGPHEAFDGGGGFGNIFIPSADVSANIDTGTNLDDYTVFKLPVGRYNLRLFGSTNARSENFGYWGIRRITTGPDDIILSQFLGRGQIGSVLPLEAVSQLAASWNVVVDDADAQYYCAAVNLDDAMENTRHYLEVERVG